MVCGGVRFGRGVAAHRSKLRCVVGLEAVVLMRLSAGKPQVRGEAIGLGKIVSEFAGLRADGAAYAVEVIQEDARLAGADRGGVKGK